MSFANSRFDQIERAYKEKLNSLTKPPIIEFKTREDFLKLGMLDQHRECYELSIKLIEQKYRQDLMAVLLNTPSTNESKTPLSERDNELKQIVTLLEQNASSEELIQLAYFYQQQNNLNAAMAAYRSIVKDKLQPDMGVLIKAEVMLRKLASSVLDTKKKADILDTHLLCCKSLIENNNFDVIYGITNMAKSVTHPAVLRQYKALIIHWFDKCFVNASAKQQGEFMLAVIRSIRLGKNPLANQLSKEIRVRFSAISINQQYAFCKQMLNIEQEKKGIFSGLKAATEVENVWYEAFGRCSMLKQACRLINAPYASLLINDSRLSRSRFNLILKDNAKAATHSSDMAGRHDLIYPLERQVGITIEVVNSLHDFSPLKRRTDPTEENFFATLYLLRQHASTYKSFNYKSDGKAQEFLNQNRISLDSDYKASTDNHFLRALCMTAFSIERIMTMYDKNWLEKRGISLAVLQAELKPLMNRCANLAKDLLALTVGPHPFYQPFLKSVMACEENSFHCNQDRIVELYKGNSDPKNELNKLPRDVLNRIGLFVCGVSPEPVFTPSGITTRPL